MFQLDFLLKLKFPILAKHMKSIDLRLDVIVTPWLLTILVHLNSQQGFPIEVIEHIWDFFLVYGWPALISICLTLLDLNQEFVLYQNLEKTIEVYTSNLSYKDLVKSIQKFEVDPRLLDDLERAYYLNSH